jgi:dTDP-4-dehydrorhamnose reductase
MKILVAGANGQLARALLERCRPRSMFEMIALGRPELDLLDPTSIERAVETVRPNLLVNAAAYTAVDEAEREVAAAFSVNRDGAAALAAAARAHGCPMIHVSTDYVFDGAKPAPYVEKDAADPIGAYGRSKLAGEVAVAAANPKHLILRTAWLFSADSPNFLRTVMRLARERPELRVVADQYGNPTFAPHLAEAILDIAASLATDRTATDRWGIYHAAAAGETSWHGFATAIVTAAAPLGVPPVPVVPITTAEYPTLAKRPANSCLDCSKLKRTFGIQLPDWRDGLQECMQLLCKGF